MYKNESYYFFVQIRNIFKTITKTRRLNTHRENEAIQFEFDMERDDCEEVARDMAKANLIMEQDARIVFKLLKSQLISLSRCVLYRVLRRCPLKTEIRKAYTKA